MPNDKKKSIIELLGITPGPWVAIDRITEQKLSNIESIENENRHQYYPVVGSDDDRIDIYTTELNLILSAPELLGALIRIVNVLKKSDQALLTDIVKAYGFDSLEAIEKACFPLKWTEIKELINAE